MELIIILIGCLIFGVIIAVVLMPFLVEAGFMSQRRAKG